MADLEYDDADDGGNVDREALLQQLEENNVPSDLIRAIEEWFEKKDVAKELGVDPEGVDSYLLKQHEDLSGLHAEEQHKDGVDKLARSTLASVEGSDSEEILDSVIYDEEGH